LRPVSVIVFVILVGLSGRYLWGDGQFFGPSSRLETSLRNSIERDLAFTFKAWVAEDEPANAGMLIVFPSGKVKTYVHGNIDMNKKRSVASISKAVTGLCVAGLVADEKLTLKDKVGNLLQTYFGERGGPSDSRILDITIAQLLTHYAGFPGLKKRKDPTFFALASIARESGVNSKQFDKMLQLIFSKRLASRPGQKYVYSNANYLILGAIIETVSGQAYEKFCADRVLAKAGVNASLDPSGTILSSYAGWYLSPRDALKVFSLFDPSNGFLPPGLQQWNSSPNNKIVSSKRSRHYGFGVVVSKRDGKDWYLHSGSWNEYPKGIKNTGSLSKSYAVMAYRSDEGVGVFTAIEPARNRKATKKLRRWIIDSYNRGLATGIKAIN